MRDPALVPRTLLVVEDSDEDYEAIIRALGADDDLVTARCRDGDDALDYLLRRGAHAGRRGVARPLVVLLDLNLPGTDGREVLRQIKRDERLRSIPVVILSTSSNPRDIAFCYRHGAGGYLVKQLDWRAMVQALGVVRAYWLETVVLPDPGAGGAWG